MLRSLILGASLALLVFGCGSSDSEAAPNGTPEQDAAPEADPGQDATTTPDSSLPACPDEVDLTTVNLPCDCYGHEANATTIVDPDCVTQVVCCPSISNLRCEDHEYLDDAGNWIDAPPEAAAEASTDAAAVDKCPNEVDLSTTTLPCDCYGTVVTDPAEAMPTCTLSVVCCPGIQGLKCE